MKTRNGFVSNSSTASFVIKKSNQFPNVFALAEHLFRQQNTAEELKDWVRDNNELKAKLKEVSDTLKKFQFTIRDKNTPIKFSSCNYDTYIVSEGNYLFIDTCNNENCFMEMNNINVNDEECQKYSAYYLSEQNIMGDSNDYEFWDIENASLEEILKEYQPLSDEEVIIL